MKKILFFLPAIVHTLATLCLNLLSGALIPLWHLWNILFWLSGVLMTRGKVWGCVLGLLPGGMILLMKGGQGLGVEVLVAAAWTVFYLACGFFVWEKRRMEK